MSSQGDVPNRDPSWEWPEWVPQDTRDQIEGFWSCFGREFPRDWQESATLRHAKPLGTPVEIVDRQDGNVYRGRWVFCWNNIGRVVGDDGMLHYVSMSDDGERLSPFGGTSFLANAVVAVELPLIEDGGAAPLPPRAESRARPGCPSSPRRRQL